MRKKAPSKNKPVSRRLKSCAVLGAAALACLILFWAAGAASGGRQAGKEVAGQPEGTAKQGQAEEAAGQGQPEDERAVQGQEPQEEGTAKQGQPEDERAVQGQEPQEEGTGQGQPEDERAVQGQGPQEETAGKDAMSVAELKHALEISDVQAMEAGAVLDVSSLPQEMVDGLFYSEEISEEVQRRIWNRSYQENNNISLGELRYLRVLHMGFDGETHIGELIVNQEIAGDILEIMSGLYKQGYPIEKMLLIDEYGAEDESSMADNNTSAFNYREIAGSSKLSNHALGLAIDINPRYNPYVKGLGNGELLVSPANGAEYADRSQEFPYKIAEGDLCLRLFREHGFTWGGDWNSVKDYQHFER